MRAASTGDAPGLVSHSPSHRGRSDPFYAELSTLHRRHGIYVYAAGFNQLTPEQQHAVDVRAVADKLGHAVARQAPVRYEPVVLRGTSSAPYLAYACWLLPKSRLTP